MAPRASEQPVAKNSARDAVARPPSCRPLADRRPPCGRPISGRPSCSPSPCRRSGAAKPVAGGQP
eukprot:5884584-Prymnesium_polylepis.1